jgi:hypothetical protein
MDQANRSANRSSVTFLITAGADAFLPMRFYGWPKRSPIGLGWQAARHRRGSIIAGHAKGA